MMNYDSQNLLHINARDAPDTGDVLPTDLFLDLIAEVRDFIASLHGESRIPIAAWIERKGRVRVGDDFPLNSASFIHATAMGVTSCASTSRPATITRRLIAELEN